MKLSLKAKLTLSLSAIAATLLVSATISVLEYAKMSSYVSDLIADDITSLNTAHRLSDICNKYNLDILTVIGDDFYAELPEFDQQYFLSHCDSLRTSLRIETYGQDLDRQAETLLRARASSAPPGGDPPPESPEETALKLHIAAVGHF